MTLDKYGRTSIRNLYYDTDTYLLIRRSIEKPAYKEKLRIRSYQKADPDTTVFVELKKKYDSVVYKRRLSLCEEEAMKWINGRAHCHCNTQISREIDYCIAYYQSLHPTCFLSYERESYFAKDCSDFRVTFDDHILCREDDVSLEADIGGIPLLNEGDVLMELKTAGSIPLWMVRILSAEHIYKTSFSKYGTAYRTLIYPHRRELFFYA